jgi:hypothetical protein
MGGGASGSELYTVSGDATSSGTVVPWKVILKMFNHEGEGWQESSTDPMAWDFWKGEWPVYQGVPARGLLGLLRGRLRRGRRIERPLPGRLPRRPATHRLVGPE